MHAKSVCPPLTITESAFTTVLNGTKQQTVKSKLTEQKALENVDINLCVVWIVVGKLLSLRVIHRRNIRARASSRSITGGEHNCKKDFDWVQIFLLHVQARVDKVDILL